MKKMKRATVLDFLKDLLLEIGVKRKEITSF